MDGKNKYFGILFVFGIIVMLMLSGPSKAVTIGIQRLDQTDDDGIFDFEARIDIHSPDVLALDLIVVEIERTSPTPQINRCYYFANNLTYSDQFSTDGQFCSAINITNMIILGAPASANGTAYGYGYDLVNGTWTMGNMSWSPRPGFGYEAVAGYGYDSYTQNIDYLSNTGAEILLNFTLNTTDNNRFGVNDSLELRAGVAGLNQQLNGIEFTYYSSNTAGPIMVPQQGGQPQQGGGGMQHFAEMESSILSAYIMQGETKEIVFSMLKYAPDDTFCLNNFSIVMPPDTNYTLNNVVSTTLPGINYTYGIDGDGLRRLIFQNGTNQTFWCGNTVWHNFTLNITSIAEYGKGSFAFYADGNSLNLYNPGDNANYLFNKSIYTAQPFNFSGMVYDMTSGDPVENAQAAINIRVHGGNEQLTLGPFTALTDATGLYQIVDAPGMLNQSQIEDKNYNGDMGDFSMTISVVKYNDSNNRYGMYTGPTLPDLPELDFREMLDNVTFYLRPAVTFKLTTWGNDYQSGGSYDPQSDSFVFNQTNIGFGYSLKDEARGFDVASDWTPTETQRFISAPLDRNYTLMLYPQMSFPMTVQFQDIAANCNATGVNLSRAGVAANCTITNGTYLIDATIDAFTTPQQFNGTINITDVDDFTVAGYLIEGGMVFGFGLLPFNIGMQEHMGSNDTIYTDMYNKTSGEFNIWLPATSAESRILIMAFANKGANSYRAIYEITTESDALSLDYLDINMSQLRNGVNEEINQNDIANGWNSTNVINTTAIEFTLVDENNTALSDENAFIEMTLSGTDMPFKWMTDSSGGVFTVTLEEDRYIEKLIIYSQSNAPLSTSIPLAVLNGSTSKFGATCNNGQCNITLRSFDPFDPDSNQSLELDISLLKSNVTCDVPIPPASCELGAMNDEEFSPFKAILMGDVSFRMTSNNVTVHYVKTDLLASGPPDALFNTNNSGSDLEAAWKFGSSGPEIYDEVIIGVPYSDDLADEDIIVNIDVLYDNDFDIIWNRSVDVLADLNDTDYADFLIGAYAAYLNGTGVPCLATDENLTAGLCYKDVASQSIWMKIPHFSGIGPVVTAAADDSNTDDGGSNNNGGSPSGGAPPPSDDDDTTDDDTSDDSDDETPSQDVVDSIIESIDADDLGIFGDVSTDDLEVTVEQTITEIVTVVSDEVQSILDDVVVDELARIAIEEIVALIANQDATEVQVEQRVEVFRVTDPNSGNEVYRTRISLTITAEEDAEEITIVQVIPKDVARTVSELVFPNGMVPRVLQDDPIIEWVFEDVKAGQELDMSYIVSKKVENVSTQTLTSATPAIEVTPEPTLPPTPYTDPDPVVEPEIGRKRRAAGIAVLVLGLLAAAVVAGIAHKKKNRFGL